MLKCCNKLELNSDYRETNEKLTLSNTNHPRTAFDYINSRRYEINWFSVILNLSCSIFKAIKPTIISVIASNPAWKELYGLDRRMNMYRSRDSGDAWQQITDGYIKEIQKLTGLVRATPLPENLVSNVPTANFTAVANSTGFTWGGKECLIWYFQYL